MEALTMPMAIIIDPKTGKSKGQPVYPHNRERVMQQMAANTAANLVEVIGTPEAGVLACEIMLTHVDEANWPVPSFPEGD